MNNQWDVSGLVSNMNVTGEFSHKEIKSTNHCSDSGKLSAEQAVLNRALVTLIWFIRIGFPCGCEKKSDEFTCDMIINCHGTELSGMNRHDGLLKGEIYMSRRGITPTSVRFSVLMKFNFGRFSVYKIAQLTTVSLWTLCHEIYRYLSATSRKKKRGNRIGENKRDNNTQKAIRHRYFYTI